MGGIGRPLSLKLEHNHATVKHSVQFGQARGSTAGSAANQMNPFPYNTHYLLVWQAAQVQAVQGCTAGNSVWHGNQPCCMGPATSSDKQHMS
jgi:hypothetical protein